MGTIRIEHAEIDQDGRLTVDLPPDIARRVLTITVRARDGEIEAVEVKTDEAETTDANNSAYDAEIETLLAGDVLLTGLGQTAAAIAAAPEIGSWADSPITDSAQYVEDLRKQMGQRYTW